MVKSRQQLGTATTRNHPWRFVAIIIPVLLAGVIVSQVQRAHNGTLSLLSPLQAQTRQISSYVTDTWQAVHQLAKLRAENQQLQQQVTALNARVASLQNAQQQNDELKKQLEIKQNSDFKHWLGASVIGRDPSDLLQYIVIDRGSNDGVHTGQPVESLGALVGQVSEVGSDWSRIILINDPSSQLGVFLESSTVHTKGIIQGQIDSPLKVTLIPQADEVHPGDSVVTSGVGGQFPEGMPIGTVKSVSKNDTELFQTALVTPIVNYNNIETVFIDTAFTPTKVGS